MGDEKTVERELGHIESSIETLCTEVQTLRADIRHLNERCDTACSKRFVDAKDFKLIRMAVIGFIAMVMTGFVGGLIALVFKTGAGK